MRETTSAIAGAETGHGHGDARNLDQTPDHLAFAAVFKAADVENRAHGSQVIHMPMQFFVAAQMAPEAGGKTTRPPCAAAIDIAPSRQYRLLQGGNRQPGPDGQINQKGVGARGFRKLADWFHLNPQGFQMESA